MRVLIMGLYVACILLAMQRADASDLDRAILKAAKTYRVPPQVLRAIAHIESSSGRNSKLRKNRNHTYDAGPMQINSVHWGTTCRHLDVSTLDGNVSCGALILSGHYKYASRDRDWMGRYHSKTVSLKHKYATKVRNILQRPRTKYTLYFSSNLRKTETKEN